MRKLKSIPTHCFRVLSNSRLSLIPLTCKEGEFGRNCANCAKSQCQLSAVFNEVSRTSRGGSRPKKAFTQYIQPHEKIRRSRARMLETAYAEILGNSDPDGEESNNLPSPLAWLPEKGEPTTPREDYARIRSNLGEFRRSA